MTNDQFLVRAFSTGGLKALRGFSRPLYHNLAGLRYGREFDKRVYGGMIRRTEGAMLYLWSKALPRGARVLEIGCYGGLSTSYIARGLEHNDGHVFAVDPFDSDLDKQASLCDQAVALENKPSRQLVHDRLAAAHLAERVTLIEGYSQEVVKQWDKPIHFLWIDGNHDQAYQDYVDWSPFLVPGGRLAIHDAHPRYGLPQVAAAAGKIFSDDCWTQLEHVKSIITGVLKT